MYMYLNPYIRSKNIFIGSLKTKIFHLLHRIIGVGSVKRVDNVSSEVTLGSSSVVTFAVVFEAGVTSSSESIDAVYGDDVTLFCTVLALGDNVNVTWSTSASISLPNSTITSTGKNEYNSTLTLANVTPESIGNYTCIVQSDFGNDTESISLNVTGTVCDMLFAL